MLVYFFHYYYYTGMRLGFGKNSGKFYVAIDSNPIQQRRVCDLRWLHNTP